MKKFILLFSVGLTLLFIFFGVTSLRAKREVYENAIDFRQWRKPLAPDYLYQLVDQHPEEKERLDSYFKVQKKFNLQPGNHKKVLSYSLFMKFPYEDQGAPIVNRESIYAKEERYNGMSWYDRYLVKLIRNIEESNQFYPGWGVRIYLSNDLAFLIDDLFSKYPHVEVFLMESSSIAHNPGAMWRFLVFDDRNVEAAISRDADDLFSSKRRREKKILAWMNDPKKHDWLRYRYWNRLERFEERADGKIGYYSPINAAWLGWKKPKENLSNLIQPEIHLDIEKAMKGFILHRQLYLDEPRNSKEMVYEKHPYGYGNEFPNFGFDERFLGGVVYYYSADQGKLSSGRKVPNFAKMKLPNDNPMLSDVAYIEKHKRRAG